MKVGPHTKENIAYYIRNLPSLYCDTPIYCQEDRSRGARTPKTP